MVKYPDFRQFVLFCMFCLSIVLIASPAFAGEASDLTFIRNVNPITTLKPQEVIRFNPQETSELKYAATGLIRLYQKFVSSQDGPTCSFHPSCSRFRHGLYTGIWYIARHTPYR